MGLGKAQQVFMVAAFCVAIGVLFALHAADGMKVAKSAVAGTPQTGVSAAVAKFESGYNALFSNDRYWVNLYGLANRALGKREVADYQVVRDGAGMLYADEAGWFREATPDDGAADVADCVVMLSDAARDAGAQTLFVQCPYKTADDTADLADYVQPGANERFDEILELVGRAGVPCLDLRGIDACRQWYRTDHHWTCDAAFAGAGEIVETLAQLPGFGRLADCSGLFDAAAYDRVEIPGALLGSAGVKVGELYAGKDDFFYLAPAFETSLEYAHFINGAEDARYGGSFEEAFIDEGLVADPGYYNKYNAFLHGGYVENIIVNRNAPNDLKCLLVSHSYGRPMAQYLSLAFAEMHYLDPQEGRYNDSYVDYVREYHPDVVIVMYDGVFNVG